MKNMLNYKSLIKVAIMIVVIALIGSQMMDTDAGRWKKKRGYDNNTSGGGQNGGSVDCSEIDAKLDVIIDKIEQIDCDGGGNGEPADCDVCPPPEGITKGWVPKTGSTINVDTGEDGNLLKGVAWPNPRFTINEDNVTVTDNLTCLMWDRDAGGKIGTWAEALNHCGTSTVGGHNDWRLPNIRELQSLIHYGIPNPHSLPNTEGTGQWTDNPTPDPFSAVSSSAYWSSTTFAGIATRAWYGDDGVANVAEKDDNNFVWCVKGP